MSMLQVWQYLELLFLVEVRLLATKASKIGGRPRVSSKDEPELTKDGFKVSRKNYNFTDKFGTERLGFTYDRCSCS